MTKNLSVEKEQDPDIDDVDGVLESLIYYNEESHFCIASFQPKRMDVPITIKGILVNAQVGESLRLTGKWIEDDKYGEQFQVKYFQYINPYSIEGVKKYLSSGLIPGIGKKFAERLVNQFGLDTLDVIENEPEKLKSVEGLGKKRLESILESWKEQKQIRDVMIFLRGYGLNETIAIKVYKQFGFKSMEEIQKDPYILSRSISGVGFITADQIAQNLGYEITSPQRVRAAISHCLLESRNNGHCFLPKEELLVEAIHLLGITKEAFDIGYEKSLLEEEIVEIEDKVYSAMMDRVEDQVAIRIVTLLKTESEYEIEFSEKILDKITPGFLLSDDQIDAIESSINSKVSIITGGPGVGKTTVLKTLTRLFLREKLEVKLCAPTGKATRRMEEATGHPASTIHRLLGFKGTNFDFNEENPLIGDIFIIDETSMIDLFLMHALLKAIPLEAKLILVGDIDQLASVGPGMVLRDFIDCKLIPAIYLKEIFRQGKGSQIILAAHRVNSGNWFEKTASDDFFFINATTPDRVKSVLKDLITTRIPQKFQHHPVFDIQVLTPMYRGDVGIDELNKMLQNELNPHESGLEIFGKEFREGDKVMQLENNYDKEVFNGDQGIIEAIDFQNKSIRVHFDEGRRIEFKKKELGELTLCYASSIHKVQGSEFPCIILILTKSNFPMLKRSLLYTGMTRGKSLVILLGDKNSFQRAIKTQTAAKRYTYLKERILKWYNFGAE
ncbi:MAG: ATP-dependent RecD-like DNA helicase [Candidatus Cloacimonadota bacterium]|nr:MAG: ATP-dependent RecD-like DNA helicase [Candidatus Cloacimonadota bacterium]